MLPGRHETITGTGTFGPRTGMPEMTPYICTNSTQLTEPVGLRY